MTEGKTAEMVMATIGYAVAGDVGRTASALQELGENSDNNQMYGVCCAIAAAGAHVLRLLHGNVLAEGDFWALSEVTPGSLDSNPAGMFARRFLVAYSNGDTATCMALFNATLAAGEEHHVTSVIALLGHVASLIQLALKEKDAGRLPT